MILEIESADDPRLDPYRHVGDAGWLRAHQRFVAEGRLVVERVLALERFQLDSILVNRAAFAAMRDVLEASTPTVLVCDAAILTSVTGYNFHRGCLALVARPAATSPSDLLAHRRILALEGVTNPDNVGGLFRTAAALGVDGIVLSPTAGDPFYRKAIRTSMGAALRVPFARVEPWTPTLAWFRAQGFTLIALTPSPSAIDLADLPPDTRDERLLVMVGAEGPGLEAATLEAADLRVRIPVDGDVDSLNVVVAAGIVLERLRPYAATPSPLDS